MDFLMEPIYNVISWVLLRWHSLWSFLLPGDGRFLGTNWEWVLAIVFLVVTVRLVLFPIFVKQIKSQRAMQALAPKIRELQAKYKGDQQTLRQEVMKLYQTEKVNPLMGCLPLLLQIPVFFGLFHVLKTRDPLGYPPLNPDGPPKTLYGWTVEQFDSIVHAQLFNAPIPAAFSTGAAKLAVLGGAHPGAVKAVAAVLVLIMMFTTFMTSRQMIMKTGWQQDPQQRMIQRLMLYGIPLSLMLGGWAFPIGVIIYWVTQNLLSLTQQQWVLRKYPPLVTAQPAPKSARERAAAATKKEPGPIARFFLVLPPPAKPNGAAAAVTPVSRRGWLGKLTGKGGWLGKQPPEAPAPPPATRSLAPRPGAKPRPPGAASQPRPPGDGITEPRSSETPSGGTTETPSRGTTETPSGDEQAAAAPRSGAGEEPPAQRRATPATGAKPARKKAAAPNGRPAGAGAAGNGSAPGGAVSGGAVSGGAVSGGSKSGGAVSGSAGASPNGAGGSSRASTAGKGGPARAATRKSTGSRKGGQSGRKGGRR